MSYILIFQILLGVSVLGMLFIFLRNLPILVEFGPAEIPEQRRILTRIRSKAGKVVEKLKANISKIVERNAHRLRVWTLKIENFLSSYLERTKQKRINLKRMERIRKSKASKSSKPLTSQKKASSKKNSTSKQKAKSTQKNNSSRKT